MNGQRRVRRERASRASHANGPPAPRLRRGLAVALRAEAEARRRSGARPFDRLRVVLSDVEGRERASGSPRGEAPRMRLEDRLG
jgi:hypothetical protein